MENQEYKVRVEHLTKYFGPLHVLDDVSFNIKKGEFLCVVGPTGCGKTTFLNLLTRIYMPTRGQLYIDNEPADPKKHNLAVVFQEPSSMPWLTVEKNLRFGMEIKKLPKEVIDERVENMIKLLGLEEFMIAQGYVSGTPSEMNGALIGANELGHRYVSGTITAEFYEYDLENLNETAETVRASVEANGTFEIVGQTVSNVYLSDSGKYLMIYTNANTDETNTALTQAAIAAFKSFKAE